MTSKSSTQQPGPDALRKTSLTGRSASPVPNLQNFSVSTPESRRVIEAFQGPNGFEVRDNTLRKATIWG